MGEEIKNMIEVPQEFHADANCLAFRKDMI